ncbi:MAG: hypothetical protein WCF16_02475 [Alphaproteobacteria bacterium]
MLAFLLAVFVSAPAPRVVPVRLGPVQREIVRAVSQPTHRFLDVEGALRSAKTWSILIAIRRVLEEHPGIVWTMARWHKGDLDQKLLPDYRAVCALMGIDHGSWNARERCYDFPNRSRLYAIHLKTQLHENRYAHVRGLTTAGFFLNQLEEIPEDVYEECCLRLSQPGYPQMLVADPNPVPETHWIASKRRFPADNGHEQHRYLHVSIWDNRHNLSPETITAAEHLYPVGHPQRRTKLEGLRGLDVHGVPVYAGAFNRTRHAERSVELLEGLPLGEAYDYGFHHPCVIWYQYAPWGWVRVLGGVLGSDLHLDAFLPIVEKYRALWFPHRQRISAVCDPAGAAENSQGLRGTPVTLLQSWYREHGEREADGRFVSPRYTPDANRPERRYAATELAATYMRRQVNGDEAFLVDPERWIHAAAELGDVRVEERFENFFLEALEAGYVLEEQPRHSGQLGTYWVPKKDGWYEHPMNCFEYGVQADVMDLPLSTERADEARVKHEVQRAREQVRTLKQAQYDPDPDDVGRRAARSRILGGRPMRRGSLRRGGY